MLARDRVGGRPAALAGATLHQTFATIDPLTAGATFVSNALALSLQA